MNNKLKPCPFCGGEAKYSAGRQREDGCWMCGAVRCAQCDIVVIGGGLAREDGTRIDGWASKEEMERCSRTAIAAWNRRAAVPNIPVKSGYIILPVPDKMLPCSPDGDLSETIKAYSYVVSRHIQDAIVTESLRLNGYVRIDGVKENI